MSQKKSHIHHGKYGFELWFWCNCTPNVSTIAFVSFKRRIQQLFLIDNSSLKVKHRRGAGYLKQNIYCLNMNSEFCNRFSFFSLMWYINHAVFSVIWKLRKLSLFKQIGFSPFFNKWFVQIIISFGDLNGHVFFIDRCEIFSRSCSWYK